MAPPLPGVELEIAVAVVGQGCVTAAAVEAPAGEDHGVAVDVPHDDHDVVVEAREPVAVDALTPVQPARGAVRGDDADLQLVDRGKLGGGFALVMSPGCHQMSPPGGVPGRARDRPFRVPTPQAPWRQSFLLVGTE